MADAAARREARRRRILENSQNRLKLISGKTGDDSPTGSLFDQLILIFSFVISGMYNTLFLYSFFSQELKF